MLPTRANQVFGEHRVIGFDTTKCKFVTFRNRVVISLNSSYTSYMSGTTTKLWNVTRIDTVCKFAPAIRDYLDLLYYPLSRSKNGLWVLSCKDTAEDIQYNVNPYTSEIVLVCKQTFVIPSLYVDPYDF